MSHIIQNLFIWAQQIDQDSFQKTPKQKDQTL